MGDPISSVLSIAGSAFGLGKSLFGGDDKPTGYSQYSGLTDALGKQSGQLMSYINSGTLPPGLQGNLKQAGDAAKASLKSMYAGHGMSGSSAELADIGNIDMKVAGQGAEIALGLLQTGIREAGMAGGMYETIMQESLNEDKALSDAISGFASGIAGFNPGGSAGGGTSSWTDAMGGTIPGVADVTGSGGGTGGVLGWLQNLF